MKKFLSIVSCSALFVSSAIGQQTTSYEGMWRGTHTVKTGSEMNVQLVIKGQSGTWQWERKAGKWSWPCAGYEFPIVMQSATPTELTIRIDAKEEVKGCPASVVNLKLVDGNRSLEGTFLRSGTTVKLTRH